MPASTYPTVAPMPSPRHFEDPAILHGSSPFPPSSSSFSSTISTPPSHHLSQPPQRRHSNNNAPSSHLHTSPSTEDPRPRPQSLIASEHQLGGPLPVNNVQMHMHQYPPQQQQYHSAGYDSRVQYQSTGHQQGSRSAAAAAADASYRHLIVASTSYHANLPQPQPQHLQRHYQQPQQQQQQHQTQRLRPIAPAPGLSAPVPGLSAPPPSNFASQQARFHYHQQQHPQLQPQPMQPTRHGQFPNTSSSSSSSSNSNGNSRNNMSPSLHPQFRAKAVCRLTCKSCLSDVCMRGMKAILLADARIELYSTDRPPKGVQLVYDDYRTRNCKCRIRDIACLGCGSTLGYHVTQPCESCLEACNNGHFWMFHSDGVSCTERYIPKTSSAAQRKSRTRGARDASSSYRPSSPPSSSSPSASASSASAPSAPASSALSSSSSSSLAAAVTEGAGAGARRTGDTTIQDPDLSFRRRTSIHDIEYNTAVSAGPHAPTTRFSSSASGEHPNSSSSFLDNNEEDSEEDEEEPQVMLWAALHTQEERYLQQMQHQFMIQQQQQQQQEQREHEQPISSAMTISPPTVGSPYHSMISSAINNASMMLWDEDRSLNQYERLCR